MLQTVDSFESTPIFLPYPSLYQPYYILAYTHVVECGQGDRRGVLDRLMKLEFTPKSCDHHLDMDLFKVEKCQPIVQAFTPGIAQKVRALSPQVWRKCHSMCVCSQAFVCAHASVCACVCASVP